MLSGQFEIKIVDTNNVYVMGWLAVAPVEKVYFVATNGSLNCLLTPTCAYIVAGRAR